MYIIYANSFGNVDTDIQVLLICRFIDIVCTYDMYYTYKSVTLVCIYSMYTIPTSSTVNVDTEKHVLVVCKYIHKDSSSMYS